MRHADVLTAKASAASRPPARPAPGPAEPEFPGCKPIRLSHDEIDAFEGRLEYWDGAASVAWVCEPTSPHHEEPSETLSELMTRVAAVRGAPIKRYGHMDLLLRGADGRKRAILQADQSVYLHPARARLPGPAAMEIGEHDFPDVVLEVDCTTDVRRGKLGLYEAWGFPEVWVEVPDLDAAGRLRRRRGLTIHRLVAGAYRASAASAAFPGWTAAEIHAGLNETALSERTFAVLRRVGAALGARDGTGPDDDPMLGWHRAEARREVVCEILRTRGIALSDAGLAHLSESGAASDDAVRAALACGDEADFRSRLRRRP